MLLLGIIAGTILTMLIYNGITSVNDKEINKAIKKMLEEAFQEGIKIGRTKDRLARFNDLCKEQIDILAAIDRPSSGPAFSRHRNGVIKHLDDLRKEKIALCKSIVADGVDPMMAITIDNKIQNMKMSEFIKVLENNALDKQPPQQNDPTPIQKTDSKTPRGKILQLVVSNEEKKNVPSSPEVH